MGLKKCYGNKSCYVTAPPFPQIMHFAVGLRPNTLQFLPHPARRRSFLAVVSAPQYLPHTPHRWLRLKTPL